MEELSRTLLVALVREVATELARLQGRGWRIHPPKAGAGFRFQQAGPPAVEAIEVRTDRGPDLRLVVDGQAYGGIDALPASVRQALGEEGLEELRLIRRLICHRLN
ncbi:MAG: hypothetical protein L6E13_02955 [Firmicutes bacterium]|nr:hypothetical protein [Bacillota bacterium]